MINLASFRYRKIMVDAGGPIERLAMVDTTVLGVRQFQANAFLRPDLVAWRTGGNVFGEAAGTGTAGSPMEARFKAISEAIERWAHMAVLTSPERDRFGFDVDPSSNGMAAFPGLWLRQARPAAQLEATERFNVLSWWEGRLPATETDTRWPGIRAVVLASNAPGVTVIVYRRSANGHYAYGHAAGADVDSACQRAAIELERHEYVVQRFLLAHAGVTNEGLPSTAHPIERRSLFFAMPEGHEMFLERLHSAPRQVRADPTLVYDGPVPGPWGKYADVWRVAYQPPSERFLGNDEHYFFW
jgi:ribosomal protein S12 methylthiotransferase accessory factor YcaO